MEKRAREVEDGTETAEAIQNQAVRLAHLESVVHRYINVEMEETIRALAVRLAALENGYLRPDKITDPNCDPLHPFGMYGRYSLWSCRGCDWIGYMKDAVIQPIPEPPHCPQCMEATDMITAEQFINIRNLYIGLTVEPAPSVSMET